MFEKVAREELPDSGLRGADFFAASGDWNVGIIGTETLERRLPRIVRALVPMSLIQLCFVPRLLRYDAVVASDGFLLGWAVSLFSRTKWIYVSVNSSVLIIRHAHHPLRTWLLRRAWRSFAAIVCLARQQREDLINFGITGKNIFLVHFGIDTNYFNGDAAESGEVILSVGKDISRDYATLLTAARISGLPIEIVASRKNIPPDATIPENVTIRYDVPLHELRAVYARARFAVVSLFSKERFGGDPSGQTVLLETLAMGRAVIATDREWLSEYLETGSDYLPVPPADPDALAKTMQKLWRDESLQKRLAEHGQRTVREKYSSRRFAEELAGVVKRFV